MRQINWNKLTEQAQEIYEQSRPWSIYMEDSPMKLALKHVFEYLQVSHTVTDDMAEQAQKAYQNAPSLGWFFNRPRMKYAILSAMNAATAQCANQKNDNILEHA